MDESFSWFVTRYAPADTTIRVARDGHAPLHFLLLYVWTYLFGDSTAAMRYLSALLGVVSVLVVYCLVYEVLRTRALASTDLAARCEGQALAGSLNCSARWGALAAALAAAVHPLQVLAGRTARMYSIGVLLAALSAWLLWRAMRVHRAMRWWIAYGLAAAAFCYTHHFAFFTLFAQTCFVGAYLICALRRNHGASTREQVRSVGGGFLLAVAVAFVLYSPWLAVLRYQSREVLEGFWIPPLTVRETMLNLLAWGTGPDMFPFAAVPVLLLLLGAAGLAAIARGGPAGWFFVLQAIVPWACCLGVSTLGGRPLLQVRYLAFAQVGLFGIWGVLASSLPNRLGRAGVASLVLALALGGIICRAGHLYPCEEPATLAAMRFLGERHQPGDLVVVGGPGELCQARHTARQLGLDHMDIRCRSDGFAPPRHTNHIAALAPTDILAGQVGSWAELAPRVWLMRDDAASNPDALSGLDCLMRRSFKGSQDSRITVALFAPETRRTAR